MQTTAEEEDEDEDEEDEDVEEEMDEEEVGRRKLSKWGRSRIGMGPGDHSPSGTSASMASIMAAAAPGGGT